MGTKANATVANQGTASTGKRKPTTQKLTNGTVRTDR